MFRALTTAFLGSFPRLPTTTTTWLLLAATVYAATAADNATADNKAVGWQGQPPTRGTFTLVSSCVITIFACTWTVLHLNVPAPEDRPARLALRKLKWMCVNVLFPELILSKAVCDLRLALFELYEFDERLRRGHVEDPGVTGWTRRLPSHHGDGESAACYYYYGWDWQIVYPRHFKLLYRLLGLPLPRSRCGPQPEQSERGIGRGDRSSATSSSPLFRGLESDACRSSAGESDARTRAPGGTSINTDDKDEADKETDEKVDAVRQPLEPGRNGPSAASAINDNDTLGPGRRRSTPPQKGRAGDSDPDWQRRTDENGIFHEKRWHTTQKWTVVHSYYAQMGGLVYQDTRGMRRHNTHQDRFQPVYYALTASKLTSRYEWGNERDHPLRYLILEEHDIKDKSKADWLLKLFAVLQITSIVLNVAVRDHKGLPITQLEISTVAFAVMAIAIYVVSWWKPKDVSRPTILPAIINPGRTAEDEAGFDRMQSLWLRFIRPVETARRSEKIGDIKRVRNDVVWMEGDV